MDENDHDIALILALGETAPTDPLAWAPDDYFAKDVLSDDIQELFQELAPFVKYVERDGNWTLSAFEWLSAYRVVTRQLYARMHARSLEQAVTGPTNAELNNAPILTHWLTVRDNHDRDAALVGLVTGHPILSTRWIRTSRLCGIDPDGAWARTNSRWYVLDEPSTPAEIIQILGDRGNGIKAAALPLHEAISRTTREQADKGPRDDL